MTAHILHIDRDFLLGANEQDEVELLRQEIAELASEISIRQTELDAIQSALAGDPAQT